ncbi:glycoside hydrolase family 28 protein [Pyrenochaeta sp. MPI-SDFR-AT-0127]|nr:glycoside hydrolase family 28 protein [Pyrenochaeta sp. MPI-SDFR-AT-0127]
MNSSVQDEGHEWPDSISLSQDFTIDARQIEANGRQGTWETKPAYTTEVASASTTCNDFDTHEIAIAPLDMVPGESMEVKVRYTRGPVDTVKIRPLSLGIDSNIQGDTITFVLSQAIDMMLEINNDKWQALHIMTNQVDPEAPTLDSENIWYFKPGVNNGAAYSKVINGSLTVPSNTTVYLASHAFITFRLDFVDVSNSGVRGCGFICKARNHQNDVSRPRELGGSSILIERSSNILVAGVTSLGARGFSLPICSSRKVHIEKFRSFSSAGNGDGIDLFCCNDILIEKCFLRNSDDTIAIYGHRWDYYGDTSNIVIRNCTLLPEIAHPIQMGTHGNPDKPETLSDILIENIDILDHCENQMWYQGCLSLNAGDENLIENVTAKNIRVERITKGQLVNIRVMKNAMWTSAPGRGVRNIRLTNIELLSQGEGIVNPSQILGYDSSRRVEGVVFENLKIGGKFIHEGMQKPRWYMVTDFVPMFCNEHVVDVIFSRTGVESDS